MPEYNLGTAQGKVQIVYDGKGVQQADRDLTKLGKNNESLKQGFTDVRNTAAVGAIAIAAGLAFATKVAIDFEKQISAIGAVSGATEKDLEKLRRKALQLGADTAFSASDAAGAMEDLAKAGIPIEGILNGAADAAVALAAAGGVTLTVAAELAADAMNSFRLSAEDLPHVADLIAGAANASSISVEDFGQSLKQVGAVATLVGVSFDDTATAIALMGKMGIKGSDAGTSLKTMLLNLQPVTQRQIDLFHDLGLVTEDGANQFFTAEGKLKSLAEVSGVLQGALAGMTEQQKLATLEIIFGQDAIRASAVLASEGADGFNAVAEAMGKISAEDVAAKRLDNTAGSLEKLKGSLETAAIALGTVFLPVVKTVADFLASAANKFSALDPKMQKMIGFAIIAAGALAALVAVIASIGLAVIGMGAAFVALKVTAIIFAIIAVVGVLAAALTKMWRESEAFRGAVTTLWDAIVFHARNLWNALKPIVAFIRDELIPQLRDGLKKAMENLKPAFTAIAAFIETRLKPAMADLKKALDDAMPTILMIARNIGGVLIPTLIGFAKILGIIIATIITVAGPVLSGLWKAFSTIISIIPPVIGLIRSFGNSIFAVAGAVGSGLGKIGVVFDVVMARVRHVVSTAMSFISRAVTIAIGAIVAAANGIGAFVSRVGAFFGQLRSAASSGVSNLISLVRGIPGQVIGAIGNLGGMLYNKGREIIQGLVDGIKSMAGAAANAVKNIVGKVTDFLPGSPAKEGPLSGQGYARTRGEHLILDFAAGIEKQADEAARAILKALQVTSSAMPMDFSGNVSQAITSTILGPTDGPRVPPPPPPGPPPNQITVTVHAPQNMNPEEVGAATARRVNLVMSTGGR